MKKMVMVYLSFKTEDAKALMVMAKAKGLTRRPYLRQIFAEHYEWMKSTKRRRSIA